VLLQDLHERVTSFPPRLSGMMCSSVSSGSSRYDCILGIHLKAEGAKHPLERICSRSRKIFGKFGKNAMCSFSSHWILRASLRCLLPREGLLHAAILGQRPYIEGLGDGYDYFQSMWRLLTWQWKNESTPMSHGCKDPSSTELSR